MDATKKSPALIHYVIVAVFCLFFRFVPGFAGITPLGMAILGCFIGAVYGWITIDMLWPSLMGLFGMGLTSIGMEKVAATCFGSLPVLGLILCMGVVGVAMKTGAFDWLVTLLLGNKAMQGKPWFTIWLVMLIAWPFGAFNPIIMMVVFGAFITSILKACGVKHNDKLAVFWYLGCAFSLMLGQILLPFMGTGLTFYYSFMTMFPNLSMQFVPYIVFMILMGVAMISVYVFLIMKIVFRVDAAPVAKYCNECETPKCNRDQKIALILFVAFLAIVIASSLNFGPVSDFLKKFGLLGSCLSVALFVPIIKSENGGPLASLEEMYTMCNWGQVFMMGLIMVFSTYLGGQDTGITSAMAMLFMPFMGMSPWVFIVIALVISVVLTNVANNMLIGVMVMPFLVNFATQAGISPTMIIVLLWIMVQFALATPAASPVTAVAMTQEMADAQTMTKAALKILPIMIVIGLVVGVAISQLVFGLLG